MPQKNIDCAHLMPRKNPLTFHYTACLIGILTMVHHNPHIYYLGSIIPHKTKQPKGPFKRPWLSHDARKEVECRPCTENSWLRSFTSFQAVEARRWVSYTKRNRTGEVSRTPNNVCAKKEGKGNRSFGHGNWWSDSKMTNLFHITGKSK